MLGRSTSRAARKLFVLLSTAMAVASSGMVPVGSVELTGDGTVVLPSAGGVAAVAVPVTGSDARPLASGRVAVKQGAGRVTTEAVPGFEAIVTVPDGQMVAVEWSDATVGAVALRARAGGVWGEWVELEADPDSAPDRASADASVARATAVGPVWTGSGTDAVELRVTSGRLADLRVDVLRADGSAPPTPTATTADAGRHGTPAINQRSAWGAGPWRCSDPATSAPLRNAIVHHTASSNRYSQSEVDDVLRGIYYFHTQSLGWCDVAYNFFVDRFGGIWEGRSGSLWAPVVGGHARGFNTGSVGVAVVGSYDGVPVPEAAFGALRRVLGWRMEGAGLAPAGWTTIESGGSTRYGAGTMVTLPVISGHRDTSLTACPGSGLYTRLAELRLLVTADIGGGGGGGGGGTGPAPPSGVSAPSGSPPVRSGHAGRQVAELQFALNYGIGSRLRGDGGFGPATEQAVRDLQLWFRTLMDPNLVVDGVYGERSHLWLQYAINSK